MYIIQFTKDADKYLDKIDKETASKIVSTLNRIIIRPHHFVKRYEGTPFYRLRVGDYRIILDIQNDKLIILVIEIGHRKNIYKK